ncbi:MAG: DUF2442 domain-containing protein [Beijerinckiaceae bacterium]
MTTLLIEIEASRPVSAECDGHYLNVRLADGRILQTPLWWYPRLMSATPEARSNVQLMPLGIHWPDIDEDLSIAGMLRGQKAPGAVPPALAIV